MTLEIEENGEASIMVTMTENGVVKTQSSSGFAEGMDLLRNDGKETAKLVVNGEFLEMKDEKREKTVILKRAVHAN